MCGIAGFNWPEKELLKEMTDCLKHRGPDQSGNYVDGNISLGHRRLSIIDLSEKGRQPMSNEDGTVWITFNGEIYNYPEIKQKLGSHRFNSKTDTEVIIHAYEEFGEDCLNLLNGDFAFAIYDNNKKKVFMARDRLGVNPLYYYAEGNKLIFASEAKAILKHPDIKKEVNTQALSDYLTLRYTPGENSIIKGIKRLPAAHCATYDLKQHKLAIRQYWDIKTEKINITENEAAERFRRLFYDSVKIRLMSDVPLGAYLSGGIDSSSIVAMMAEIMPKEEIKTFSVGFGYGEETDELKYAQLISEKFSTEHTQFTIEAGKTSEFQKIAWHMDEPISDPAIIPVYFLSQSAKKKATVALTGDGGDEIIAGYEQHKFLKIYETTKKLGPIRKLIPTAIKAAPYPILNKAFKYSKALGQKGKERAISMLTQENEMDAYMDIISVFTEKEKKQLLKEETLKGTTETKNTLIPYFPKKADTLTGTLIAEIKTTLPEDYLMKANKMGLAHAVEQRVPFLDHRLVEYSFTLPNSLKLHGFNEKYLLKKAMAKKLPKEILNRKKQRFYVPIDTWIKNELKPMFENIFSKENMAGHPHFRQEYIQKLLEQYNNSPLFYGRQLWSVFAFEVWRKTFIQNEKIMM